MTIRYLEDRRGADAAPSLLVAAVYSQMRREFGLVSEPFQLQAPAPPVLAAAWASLREGVLVGVVPRRIKETVAAVISQLNRCPYCVDVHTSLVHAAGGRKAAWELRRRGGQAISDPALRAAAGWAAATRSPGAAILAAPPFDSSWAPEMIATAACFHYINRLVTIFLDESPFPSRARLFAAPMVLFTSRFFAPRLRGRLTPGESLAWLPQPVAEPAALPADLAWARPRPEIAAAFAAIAAAVEAEAGGPLGEGAAAVRRRLAVWGGEELPLDVSWADEVTAGLPERSRPAARLALLTALAPYRVGAAEVAAFRAAWPGDRALVGVTTWASFTAARRITSWLASNPGAASDGPRATGVAS
jgi:AhpD family alkylhydroperoxidase